MFQIDKIGKIMIPALFFLQKNGRIMTKWQIFGTESSKGNHE